MAIEYCTMPQSSALQWLEPQMTADKRHPFLFTQCQAIHARSLFPCQDTPRVKFTFSASVGLILITSCMLLNFTNPKHGLRILLGTLTEPKAFYFR